MHNNPIISPRYAPSFPWRLPLCRILTSELRPQPWRAMIPQSVSLPPLRSNPLSAALQQDPAEPHRERRLLFSDFIIHLIYCNRYNFLRRFNVLDVAEMGVPAREIHPPPAPVSPAQEVKSKQKNRGKLPTGTPVPVTTVRGDLISLPVVTPGKEVKDVLVEHIVLKI